MLLSPVKVIFHQMTGQLRNEGVQKEVQQMHKNVTGLFKTWYSNP
jgi:hypothetical protein